MIDILPFELLASAGVLQEYSRTISTNIKILEMRIGIPFGYDMNKPREHDGSLGLL